MPSSFFFARLVPNRPNFVMTMAIGRYEIAPLGPTMARPARPA